MSPNSPKNCGTLPDVLSKTPESPQGTRRSSVFLQFLERDPPPAITGYGNAFMDLFRLGFRPLDRRRLMP
jgi:hypothetical protein